MAILADQLQLWGFEDHITIFTDGSLGFGLECTPVDVSCWANDQINSLAVQTDNFLNSLPSGIDIQFIQEIKGGNDAIIKKHRDLSVNTSIELLPPLVNSRINRLLSLDDNGELPKHSLKVFVRKPLTRSLISKSSFFSKTNKYPEIAEDELKKEVQILASLQEKISKGLAQLGLNPKVLTSDEIIELCYVQWNPSRGVTRPEYDPQDVRSSILFTDASAYEMGFSLGRRHHRVISLKSFSENTFASMAQALRELPFDSRVFLSVRTLDQQKELESLQLNRRMAFSMARGRNNGMSDIESEAKLQDIELLLQEIISNGQKVYLVSLNILLCSDSEYELDAQVNHTLMKIRELAGCEGMEETIASFDIFLEFSFPNARALERSKKVKTVDLSHLLPIYGPWKGHDRPSLLLRSRMGNLVGFDPFSQDLTNYNQIVSGGSGSGKSFLTTILLLQLLKENPKVFIVDIGGSYKKLCEHLSGQYIELGMSDEVSFNPFDLLPGETVPSSSKIKFLVGLIEMMTKEEGRSHLGRLERSILEESIQQVYDLSAIPSLSKLRDILLNHTDVEIRRLGRILTSWCGDTPYGKFVDRPTSIELSNSIVCFDLKGLEVHPDLQAVSLYIITDFVWREVQRDRGAKKFLIFDECWKLLESESGSLFIAEVFRTFRKYYASAIAISQNIDDFAKSRVSTAILSNSAIKWILMQRGSDQKRLQEVLQLNDNEMGLISSLHQERGFYSEAFLMAQDQRAVVAVESTPLEYWIATTDPRDLAMIEKVKNEDLNRSHLEILKMLSEKYPNGVVGTKAQETKA